MTQMESKPTSSAVLTARAEGRADRLGSTGPAERVDLESELHDCRSFRAAPGGRCSIEGLDLGRGKREGEGAGVVGRLAAVLGTRNWQDEWVLNEPAERDLGRTPVVRVADLAEEGDDGRDRLAFLPPEAGHEPAEAGGPRAGHELAGQGAVCQWLVGDERDTQLPTGVEHAIGFRLAVEERVLDLVRGQRDAPIGQDTVGQPHLIGRVVADPDRPDLALLDCVGHQVHEPRDRDPAGWVVVHVQVERRALEELEAPLERPWHHVRSGQHVRRELRRDRGRLAHGPARRPGARRRRRRTSPPCRRASRQRPRWRRRRAVPRRGSRAATVRQLGRGPAGAARGIAPGHGADAQARDKQVGLPRSLPVRHAGQHTPD